MELEKWMCMTKEERLNEPGTMPPCPFCQRPRVQRSDYVRCNLCGTNWLEGEDLTKDPRSQRMKDWIKAQEDAGTHSMKIS